MLTILANLRVNDRERLQHLKDSFRSFHAVSDNWLINVRGKLRDETVAFLKENLGQKMVLFELLDDSRGWITNALDMLKSARYDYVLIWNEDHLNTAPQELYNSMVVDMANADADYLGYSWWLFGKDRGFFDRLADELEMRHGDTIDVIYMTRKKWNMLLESGYPYFLLSLCGIYKKDLLQQMMLNDTKKLPMFLTKFLFKVMGFLNVIGIRFNTKKAFDRINGLFFNKLRKYPKETPFEIEKPPTRVDMLPLRIALPRQELFACIDDDLNVQGYSLVSRGLYNTAVAVR